MIAIEVWGSREWYRKALPLLAEAGLRDLPGRSWADPATDGERMIWLFDLDGPAAKGATAAVDAALLEQVLTRVRSVVLEGEAPSIDIRFVPSSYSPPSA